jgi:mono/diheme cytochrome c family protein
MRSGAGVLWMLSLLAQPGTNEDRIARGLYLSQHVAMCVECHTPRNAVGELERSRLFEGAPIPVGPPPFAETWASRAPALAGLKGWTDEDFVTLLTTGRRANGTRPRPPMPSFRLAAEDAVSIAAYLRSIEVRTNER